ncbi:hypothetical protein [Silicimonas sp. MF1-12-2]|uniref:hypothetical protein n=1 Tax=Silicimonas sp. MF1-12-2 TaxID=3384793 RepID=UPI0039B57167
MARKVFLISCCILAAACSDKKTTPYTVAADGYAAIAGDFAEAGYEVTPVGDIPTENSAVYDGYIILDAGSIWLRESYAGEMTLEAQFDANTVSGSADNLYDRSGAPVAGSLVIGGGVIDRASPSAGGGQITADLDGLLTDSKGVDLTVDTEMVGDFYGPDAEGFLALINGTMSSPEHGVEDLTGRSIGVK